MNSKINVYIAGDSIVQTYDKSCFPQAGWGQFINKYFEDYNLNFINCSIGGRSSKTFIQEGRLEKILNNIKQNDYLLVQMGHNDSLKDKPERYTEPKVEFKKYLNEFIYGAKAKGAIPILITPLATLKFDGNEFLNQFKVHCNSMRELAEEQKVPIIDLMNLSLNYFKNIGYKEVFTYYMVSYNGTDCAHLTEKGADMIASIVSKQLKKIIKI